jgi:hypothetical protein
MIAILIYHYLVKIINITISFIETFKGNVDFDASSWQVGSAMSFQRYSFRLLRLKLNGLTFGGFNHLCIRAD